MSLATKMGGIRIIFLATVLAHCSCLATFQCADDVESCSRTPSDEYLSLLQRKAGVVLSDEVTDDKDMSYVVPPPANETPTDVLCKLKSFLSNATFFQAVRDGDVLTPPTNKPLQKRTCAVVSSSGVLNLHRYGQEIDRASMVIRFNEAPTDGFEDHVGAREGWRIVNEKVLHEFLGDKNFGKKQDAPGTPLRKMGPGADYLLTCSVCGIGKKMIMDHIDFKEAQVKASKQDYELKLFASDLSLERLLFSFLHDEYGVRFTSPAGPTTGAIGMLVALSECDEITAYGMGDSINSADTPYHYYDKPSGDVSHARVDQTRRWHNSFDSEKDLWRRVATNSYYEINYEDKIVTPGFSQVNCPTESLASSIWDDLKSAVLLR